MTAIVTKKILPTKNDVVTGRFGQNEVNRRIGRWYKSDAIITAAGVMSHGATTNTVFVVPENSMIVNGFVRVEEAFDASGTSTAATATLTLASDSGTVTLFDAANTLLQDKGAHPCTTLEGAITPATTTGNVTLLIDPATSVQGTLRVYLEIVQLDNL